MVRKLTLAATTCMALIALGAMAPSAFAGDPGGNGQCPAGQPPNIYNDLMVPGTFDLTFTPTTANTAAEVNGGANLCGASDTSPKVFYQHGRIFYPGKGEKVRCAAPNINPQVAAIVCGNDPLLPDRAYAGSAQTDNYCNAGIFTVCLGGTFSPNVPSKTRVSYDTKGPGGGPNRCVDTPSQGRYAVACFESEGQILPPLGPTCNSDIIVEGNASTMKFEMTLYQPTCTSSANPTYFANIDDLHICRYAGAVGGNSCGSDPADWLNKNGSGSYTFKVGAIMTDGAIVYPATTSGTW